MSAATSRPMTKSPLALARSARASGEQALSDLRSNSYEILILGCGCPDISCRELIRQSKKIRPALQIVLLGNMPPDQEDCDCHPVDIRRFYEKPFDLNELLGEIDRIVSSNHPRGQRT